MCFFPPFHRTNNSLFNPPTRGHSSKEEEMSGSGSGLFGGNTSNETIEIFSCRNFSFLSSSNLTNVSHWQILGNLQVGATVVGVLILLFFIIATIWNLFIVITFFVKHSLLKEPANIFLLNVALTDLLICLTTMVFSFVTAFGQEFVFGSSDVTRCTVCNMSGFFIVFLIFVTLHLLMALSIDRFILLSRPLRYKRLMNRWRATLICIIVYVICFILAVLPLAGFGEYEFNARFAACVPRFTPTANFFYVVILAVESLIPIVVLAITNVWTYRLVSKFLKRNFKRKSTYRRKEQMVGSKGREDEGEKHQKQQKQLVKVFGALFIANIISYTPTIVTIFLFLALILNGRENIIPSEVYIIGFVSFLTNSVFHPIIESFFVKELRYQVNRARAGVRRVSTSIYRQTTQLFSSNTLDEANRKVDLDDSTPRPKRSIRFLNGKKCPIDDSMVTEMEDMPSNEHSSTPIPTPEPHDVTEATTTSKGNGTTASPGSRKKNPMLSKGHRSVTFQDNIDTSFIGAAPVELSDNHVVGHPRAHSESCLKLQTSIDIIVEENSVTSGDERLDSSSPATTGEGETPPRSIPATAERETSQDTRNSSEHTVL